MKFLGNKPAKYWVRLLFVAIAGLAAAAALVAVPFFYLIYRSTGYNPISAIQPVAATATPVISVDQLSFNPNGTRSDLWGVYKAIEDKDYASAVLQLDQLIAENPEDSQLYFTRADTYYRMFHAARIQAEGEQYIFQALKDIDRAIEIGPAVEAWQGDQYYTRFTILEDISYLQRYRADMIAYQQSALENLEMANNLGNSAETSQRLEANWHFYMGECDEGFDDINRLFDAQPADQPSAGLHTIRALGTAMCKQDYESALADIDRALEIYPSTYRWKAKALLLYYLGREEEAKAVLDSMIIGSPAYDGDRYYLRALILFEQGQKELAEADLQAGSGNTWYHGGLYPYVKALLALDAGEQETGIALMQEAEATMIQTMFYSPFIERIQGELAELGAEPLAIQPGDEKHPTPMPAQP